MPVSIVHTESDEEIRVISLISLSLRIDVDVLDWFKARGSGYQTRINAVLRAFKEATL